MSAWIFALLLLLAGLAVAAAMWDRRRGATVVIAAEPDAALRSTAAALRRLGARITRYDSAMGTLEARGPSAGIVRVRAIACDGQTTRIDLDGDARAVIRRLRGALSA